jgi:TolB-like protein/thioredoxin-like negative regulator of GroEL
MAPSQERMPRRRLAVVPFAGPQGSSAADYVREGLAEEIIARLARLHPDEVELVARSITSAWNGSIDHLAAVYRLDFLLTGSLAIEGEAMRVHVELVRAADGTRVWSETLTSARADLGELVAELAASIAARLPLREQAAPRARLSRALEASPRAYESYFLARYFWNRRSQFNLGKALELYRQALQHDPSYAPAYLGIAECYTLMVTWSLVWPNVGARLARAALAKALTLDAELAGARAAQAWLASTYDWSFREADTLFRDALSQDPSDAQIHFFFGRHLLGQGRMDEGLAQLRASIDLEPYSVANRAVLGWGLFVARQPEESLKQLDECLAQEPDCVPAHGYRSMVLSYLDRGAEAVAAARRALKSGGDSAALQAALAYSLARNGQRNESRAILDRLARASAERYCAPALVAPVALALDDEDEALNWLERALAQRCCWLALNLVDPRFDGLRHDPRFGALTGRVTARAPSSRPAAQPVH